MAKDSDRLVQFGFSKGNKIEIDGKTYRIEGDTPEKRRDSLKKLRESLPGKEEAINKALEGIADHEWAEVAKNQLAQTNYPTSISRYHIVLESWTQSVESAYYWCLNFFNDALGFGTIDKITDTFSAAEHSSFYGAAGQRLGLAQDKVAQYLATVGKMIKDLFQIVRELRWIDERLSIYREAFGHEEGTLTKAPKLKDGRAVGPSHGSEVTLKGLWADLVDGVVGGQRTGSNIFLMQQQLQFTTLPDLFFAIHPQKPEDVDKVVDEQASYANDQVKNVLKRKLVQYAAWRNSTYDEMLSRRRFTLDYLSQHYYVIKLYLSWIKPYLKHIKRLSADQSFLDNPRLISAFESNIIEVEILARQIPVDEKDYSCVLLTLEYHTKPSMQYQGDAGYHRGPIHVGVISVTWRSYAWTAEQVKNFLAMKAAEDIDLMKSVDSSLAAAMDQLGTDVEDYLKEAALAGKTPEAPTPEKDKGIDIFEPFVAVGRGVKDAFGSLIPSFPKFAGKKDEKKGVSESLKARAKRSCFTHYNIFKKAHGMLSW